MSLIQSNVQENTHGRSECASRRWTAIQPRQQPLFRGEKEGKVHYADLSDCPQGRSSQERTYESRQRGDDTVCVDTLNVSARREMSTGEDSISLW